MSKSFIAKDLLKRVVWQFIVYEAIEVDDEIILYLVIFLESPN